MRQKGVVLRTTLSTRECAEVFKQASGRARGPLARVGELAAKVGGNDNSGFFTPSFDSPFDSLNRQPDFAVGIFIGKFSGGGQGAGRAVHMYVMEDDSHRHVEIVSPHTLTGGMQAARLVRIYSDAFQKADDHATVVDGNI